MSYNVNSNNQNANIGGYAGSTVFNSQTFKEGTKIILPNKEEYELPDDMSIEEILESLKEDAAYSNITEQNVNVDDDGNVRISNPKVRVNGYLL